MSSWGQGIYLFLVPPQLFGRIFDLHLLLDETTEFDRAKVNESECYTRLRCTEALNCFDRRTARMEVTVTAISTMDVKPVMLVGQSVRLVPLSLDHVPALAQVGLDPELWRLQPTPIDSETAMRGYVEKALDDERRGTALAFAILDQASDQVIGSTRYMDIAPMHRRLEIGATWLTSAYQRTAANTEAKLLLLTHAFEALGAIRVVFKTEVLNRKSRAALARIGAVEEGTFRKHLITDSGRPRDMVYYAILDDEWPDVKARLIDMLDARRPATHPADWKNVSG